jgi:hypothetical protein
MNFGQFDHFNLEKKKHMMNQQNKNLFAIKKIENLLLRGPHLSTKFQNQYFTSWVGLKKEVVKTLH